MQPTSIQLAGADGLKLHALEWSREGTLMLFLHGFSNSAHVWDEIAPVVAPYYRVVALDQRGHGDSDHDPERRYDPDTMAADIERVLEQLGAERLVLVGHSMGGRVSIAFAGRRPEALAGLVLVDIGPENDPRGALRISLETQKQEWSFDSVEAYTRVLVQQYPETSAPTLARMAEHWTRRRADGRYELKMDAAFMQARTAEAPGEGEARERASAEAAWKILRDLRCPALVVRGAASDILSADVADRMVDEAIPSGQLAVIPQAAHSVMLDNPVEFERALSRFALGED
jgi:pimeloyl-ACP methyl ester carboxylesterase